MSKKLNIGCGLDYREGYINIDGSDKLENVDLVYDFSNKSLLNHFNANSFSHILANDIVEHLFHWEAVRLLKDFYTLLESGGMVEIRVPDCEYIISSTMPINDKLILLFGGQDTPQDSMNDSRQKYPQYFCHKYGWIMKKMWSELDAIGFRKIEIKSEGNNFVTTAVK